MERKMMLQALIFLMIQTRLSKRHSPAHTLISLVILLVKLLLDKTRLQLTIIEQVAWVELALILEFKGSDM